MSVLEHYWRTWRWLVVAGASGIVYLALILYVLAPMGYALLHQRTFLQAQRAQLEQAQAWASTERVTRARIGLLEQAAQALRRDEPGNGSLDVILTTLAEAAGQAGLTVRALKTSEGQPGERAWAWPLHMEAEGRYHQVGAFIDYLERGSDLLIIEHLELSAPRMQSANLNVRFDVIRYQLAKGQE